MNTSEKIGNIAGALSKFQSKIPPIKKDRTVKVTSKRTGQTYTFKYATMDGILETIRPILSECNLAFTHLTTVGGGVECVLMHESGEWIATEPLTLPISSDADAQAMGSAITYARRYTLCAVLGITADEDDDGNAASGNSTQPKPQPKPVVKEKPELLKNSEAYGKVVKAIERDGYTVEDVETKYRLTTDMKKSLEIIQTDAWKLADGIIK